MSVDEAARRARFAPILRAELAALQAQSAKTGADRRPVEPDQQSVGRLSRMDAIQGQQMAAAIEARRGQRIVAIRAALARIDADEFGWCEDCGDDIGEARLAVDATVRRCVACAQARG